MDKILHKETRKFAIPYLDDIIVFSNSLEDHKKHLEIVMGKMKAAGISLNKKKCRLFREEIKILGHVVSERKIKPDPEKLLAIQNYEKPSTIKEIRAFLGLTNFCRNYIPNYATLAAPLYSLLNGEIKKCKSCRLERRVNEYI
jgi:hypothetical protein